MTILSCLKAPTAHSKIQESQTTTKINKSRKVDQKSNYSSPPIPRHTQTLSRKEKQIELKKKSNFLKMVFGIAGIPGLDCFEVRY